MSQIKDALMDVAAIVFIVACFVIVPIWVSDSHDDPIHPDAAAAIRAEQWERKALHANPNLTEHELIRIRAAAMYLERAGAKQ